MELEFCRHCGRVNEESSLKWAGIWQKKYRKFFWFCPDAREEARELAAEEKASGKPCKIFWYLAWDCCEMQF